MDSNNSPERRAESIIPQELRQFIDSQVEKLLPLLTNGILDSELYSKAILAFGERLLVINGIYSAKILVQQYMATGINDDALLDRLGLQAFSRGSLSGSTFGEVFPDKTVAAQVLARLLHRGLVERDPCGLYALTAAGRLVIRGEDLSPDEPRGLHHVRVLHLSDLHERGGRENERWRRYRVLGESFKSKLIEISNSAVDLVVFTGDLADHGKAEEYETLTPFIDECLDLLGLGRERFFPVPGNHDIDRSARATEWAKLRTELTALDSLAVSRWVLGLQEPRHVDSGLVAAVLERGSAYNRWVSETLGRSALLPRGSPHGHLGYRATLNLPGRPFPVHVIGLNTAWLSGDEHEAGRLILTEDQAARLSLGDNGRPLPGLRLGLCHHPLTDLRDAIDVRKHLSTRAVDLLLRGHLHHGDLAATSGPDQSSHLLAAGCLYEGDRGNHYRNAFHVIDIMTDEHGRPQRYEIDLLGYSDAGDGFWFPDPGLYRAAPSGRLVWPVAAWPRDGWGRCVMRRQDVR